MNYDELKKCLLSRVNENNNNINTLDNKLKNNNINNTNNTNNINTPNKSNKNIDINNNINSLSENKNECSQNLFGKIYDNYKINEIKEEKDENIEQNNPNENEDNYDEENENENESDNENVENMEEEDDNEDYLPVYNTKNIIVDYDNTQKRLEETNKLLYKLEGPLPSTDMEEDSLEIKIDLDVDKDNPKEVNYNDYKKVINKYLDKNSINFTIPKPFTFQEDTKSKINGVKKL